MSWDLELLGSFWQTIVSHKDSKILREIPQLHSKRNEIFSGKSQFDLN